MKKNNTNIFLILLILSFLFSAEKELQRYFSTMPSFLNHKIKEQILLKSFPIIDLINNISKSHYNIEKLKSDRIIEETSKIKIENSFKNIKELKTFCNRAFENIISEKEINKKLEDVEERLKILQELQMKNLSDQVYTFKITAKVIEPYSFSSEFNSAGLMPEKITVSYRMKINTALDFLEKRYELLEKRKKETGDEYECEIKEIKELIRDIHFISGEENSPYIDKINILNEIKGKLEYLKKRGRINNFN